MTNNTKKSKSPTFNKKALKSKDNPIEVIDKTVPEPNKDHAKASLRIISEHIYWLGDAIVNNDSESAQREVDIIVRYSRTYHAFAKSPALQPVKYLKGEYPPKKRHIKTEETEENSD